MDAFTHTLEKPETLLRAYALINRIRLCASPTVLHEAERLGCALPTSTSPATGPSKSCVA